MESKIVNVSAMKPGAAVADGTRLLFYAALLSCSPILLYNYNLYNPSARGI